MSTPVERGHDSGERRTERVRDRNGVLNHRNMQSTFILPIQSTREKLVRLKVNPVKSIVKGRRIVLIDDSIVRGTTMKKIVQILRHHGAKEVHVRIGSPPIIAPCYFGIDMTTRKQLMASSRSIKEVEKKIGADSLAYISIDGMVEAIGVEKEKLCLGCVTGEYPVKIEGEKYRFQEVLEKWKEE